MTDRARNEEVEILERGHIYFFYRPAVGEDAPRGLVDVQRFHFVLSPEGRELFRMITVGKKRLPEPDDAGQRFWGYVERAAESSGEIVEELERGRMPDGFGTRRSARPAVEGVYALARHGNHVHLFYALELPQEPDEVQRELRIGKQGSYLLSVKNPQASSPPSVGLEEERKAEFPDDLQERFGDRRHPPVSARVSGLRRSRAARHGLGRGARRRSGRRAEPRVRDRGDLESLPGAGDRPRTAPGGAVADREVGIAVIRRLVRRL